MTTEELIPRQRDHQALCTQPEAFDNLTEQTDFLNDLKINSANLVDVVLDIETTFDIIIDNESMEKC